MKLPDLKWWQWGIILFIVVWIIGRLGEKSATVQNVPSTEQKVNEWYEGGNLHKATVAQWRVASEQNKLATAADWLAGTRWKGNLNSRQDFNRMKVKAEMLVNEVNKTANMKDGKKIDHWQIVDIATSLMLMTKDFDP